MSVPPKVGIRFAKILIKKRKVKDKSLFFHFTSSFVGIFHIPKRDYPIIPTYKTHFLLTLHRKQMPPRSNTPGSISQ